MTRIIKQKRFWISLFLILAVTSAYVYYMNWIKVSGVSFIVLDDQALPKTKGYLAEIDTGGMAPGTYVAGNSGLFRQAAEDNDVVAIGLSMNLKNNSFMEVKNVDFLVSSGWVAQHPDNPILVMPGVASVVVQANEETHNALVSILHILVNDMSAEGTEQLMRSLSGEIRYRTSVVGGSRKLDFSEIEQKAIE